MTPQQIASLRQQQQQHSGSGPPPLLLAPRASVPNVQVQGQRIIQQGLIRVANVANSNVVVNIPQVSMQHTSLLISDIKWPHLDFLKGSLFCFVPGLSDQPKGLFSITKLGPQRLPSQPAGSGEAGPAQAAGEDTVGDPPT